MARNNGGVFGQLRGKIGDVVFSVSRGMQTSRRYQPVVNNPKSVKQEQQRSLFTDSVEFVQKQCRFAIANVLKKKYTGTTAYAQLVGSSLSLRRMNDLPSEKSRSTFEKSWITRSSLGRVIPKLVGGIKVVNGSAKFVADTTLTTVWVGLSLPLNFYEGRDLESVEGYLRAIMVAQTQSAGNQLYYIASAGVKLSRLFERLDCQRLNCKWWTELYKQGVVFIRLLRTRGRNTHCSWFLAKAGLFGILVQKLRIWGFGFWTSRIRRGQRMEATGYTIGTKIIWELWVKVIRNLCQIFWQVPRNVVSLHRFPGGNR